MKKHMQTSISMNNFSTEVVSRFACRAKSSQYSRCSSDFKFDKRGISIGEPRLTKRVQTPSHARLPLALVVSPSRGGFDKLRSSFPILSACLWKNRCSTIRHARCIIWCYPKPVVIVIFVGSWELQFRFSKNVSIAQKSELRTCILVRKSEMLLILLSRSLFKNVM